jgi:hypothetical protein
MDTASANHRIVVWWATITCIISICSGAPNEVSQTSPTIFLQSISNTAAMQLCRFQQLHFSYNSDAVSLCLWENGQSTGNALYFCGEGLASVGVDLCLELKNSASARRAVGLGKPCDGNPCKGLWSICGDDKSGYTCTIVIPEAHITNAEHCDHPGYEMGSSEDGTTHCLYNCTNAQGTNKCLSSRGSGSKLAKCEGKCECVGGWTGALCTEYHPSVCPSQKHGNLCLDTELCSETNNMCNNQTCNEESSGLAMAYCQCDNDHYGRFCDGTLCDADYCLHGGRCKSGPTVEDRDECICDPAYHGSRCEISIVTSNCTDDDVCNSHGACTKVEGGGNFSICTCNDGWIGTTCEIAIVDACTNMTACQNGGHCHNNHNLSVSSNGQLLCFCTDSFTGRNCENSNSDPAGARYSLTQTQMKAACPVTHHLMFDTDSQTRDGELVCRCKKWRHDEHCTDMAPKLRAVVVSTVAVSARRGMQMEPNDPEKAVIFTFCVLAAFAILACLGVICGFLSLHGAKVE